ncbi:MAG TPA: glycosyltransferase family 4 protein [Dissulfurispiraceae bacterium]|nr:glycosyltransferase family 4 protein [Dissulfurispiraceae bacterium]
MRLAFVKKRFSLHGGAELYLKTLLGALRKEWHDLHVFANSWTDEPGVKFHKIDIIKAGSYMSVRSFSRNSAKTLRREKFDCIVSFERTEYQDIYRAGEGCHRAWLDLRSEIEPAHKKLTFKLNPLHRYMLSLEEKIFKNTPLIVANSNMVREQIHRYYGTSLDKIAVAYNGVDLTKFTPANRSEWRLRIRSELGIADAARVILFVGSGFRRKGLEMLINALPAVKKAFKGERIVVVVIGKGDSSSYTETATRLDARDNILFLGPRSGIEKFYAAADIFVLPTVYDPFSNACLEAMASGLPVVTTRNNGAAEIIEEGKEGFVTSSITDSSELADKVVLSLNDAVNMGMRARARAEEFSIEDAAQRFAALIGAQRI